MFSLAMFYLLYNILYFAQGKNTKNMKNSFYWYNTYHSEFENSFRENFSLTLYSLKISSGTTALEYYKIEKVFHHLTIDVTKQRSCSKRNFFEKCKKWSIPLCVEIKKDEKKKKEVFLHICFWIYKFIRQWFQIYNSPNAHLINAKYLVEVYTVAANAVESYKIFCLIQ